MQCRSWRWSLSGPAEFELGPLTFLWGNGLTALHDNLTFNSYGSRRKPSIVHIPLLTNEPAYRWEDWSRIHQEQRSVAWDWLGQISFQDRPQNLKDEYNAFENLSLAELRFLKIVMSILKSTENEEGSLIVIEEPFYCIHPTHMVLFVELFEMAAKDCNAQIVAHTMNPLIFDWFSESTLKDTLVFAVHPSEDVLKVVRLGDLPHLDVFFKSRRDPEFPFVNSGSQMASMGWLELAVHE